MFSFLALLCVVVLASRDGWLQQNINILYIILTNDKLTLKNTNVNNCILENTNVVPLYHTTNILMMVRE
jgi:hypothetical protein